MVSVVSGMQKTDKNNPPPKKKKKKSPNDSLGLAQLRITQIKLIHEDISL